METNSNLSKLSEIKNALSSIINSLPIDADKLMEMFYDLTNCEIEYAVESIEQIR